MLKIALLALLAYLNLAEAGRGCVDIFPGNCVGIVKNGMCRVHAAHYKKWCPKTCGYCVATPPPYTIPPMTNGPLPTCGKPEVQGSRVISGDDAVPNSWPWQVRLFKNKRGICGGTLVHPRWVITAAHCISRGTFTIRVGDHDLLKKEGTESEYKISKVIVHPGWDRRSLNNDIAMLKVSRPVIFTREVSSACLPETDVKPGAECYITGWGKIQHPGRGHNILQQAMLPVVDSKTCEKKNKQILGRPVTPQMICAGDGGKTKKSGCHGDSGGPFVCRQNGKWELHGAVSHGSPRCESTETYTVFSRITAFRTWIDDNMQNQ